MQLDDALALIREIPDYPKPGIRFQDITPLLADPESEVRAPLGNYQGGEIYSREFFTQIVSPR